MTPRPLLLPLLLAGCSADQGGYPSLQPRPIETRSDAEPVITPVPVVPDPALDRRIAELNARLASAASSFAAKAGETAAKAQAASGQPVGAEGWIAAQASLAQLDGFRADTLGTLTDIEKLITDRASGGQPDYPGLGEARARATAQLDVETARIAVINRVLAR